MHVTTLYIQYKTATYRYTHSPLVQNVEHYKNREWKIDNNKQPSNVANTPLGI